MTRTAKKDEAPTTPAQLRAMLNKHFGPGTVIMGNDPSLEIVRIPTGILSIDLLTQGGFPRNRHIELYGSAGVGKTVLSYRLIASAQELGLRCAFFDVEKTYDPKFAESAGVDIAKLDYIDQKETGNRLIDIMETHLRSGFYDVLVLDSIAALLPRSEREKDMEAGSYGTEQAKMMSAALRRLTAANKRTVIVYLNQTRDSIGSIFAAAQRTSGGRALSFYAGMRLELVRVENIKRKSTIVNHKDYGNSAADVIKGHRVLVSLVKNKTGGAPTESKTTFVFDYDIGGIDPLEDLFYCGRYLGWIHKKGDYFYLDGYESEKKNGKARFKAWLRDNPDIADELEYDIRNVEWLKEEEDG